MKSVQKLLKLAYKFEVKKYAQEVSQTGTTELFFDSEKNQMAFADILKNQNSPVFKILMNYYTKTEKPCGYSLKMTATPSKGASWDLVVTPNQLTSQIKVALDTCFKSVMKESMAQRLVKADAGAKKGSGSGTLDLGSTDLSP
jgi:hypothetical protein